MRAIRCLLACVALLVATLPVTAFATDTVELPADVVGAPAETVGTVIGTIGYRKGMNEVQVDAATIGFRRVGSTEAGQLVVQRGALTVRGNTGDVEDGKFAYAAFKFALPEGEYELFRVDGAYGIYPMTLQCVGDCAIRTHNATDFSVRFTVVRGQVLYLGSFLAHGTVEKGKLGFIPMPVPSTVYFSWADKWARDAAAFAAGPRAVDAAAVVHAALAVNANAQYYLIAEDHVVEPKMKMSDLKFRASFAGKIAAYTAEHPEAAAPAVEASANAPVAAPATAPVQAAATAPVLAPATAPAAAVAPTPPDTN
jgi:hypothetical protein